MGSEPQRNGQREGARRSYHRVTGGNRDSGGSLSYRAHSVSQPNWLIVWSIVAIALTGAAVEGSASSAIARPVLSKGSPTQRAGTAFFVALEDSDRVAAVGTAHTLSLRDVAKAGRVEFVPGDSTEPLSTSSAFLVPPGIPFRAPGGTIAGDFFVYALDSTPTGVRPLEFETDLALAKLEPGTRVQLLAIPTTNGANEVGVHGRIAKISAEQIEIDLEQPFDLGGSGGVPVISTQTGRVIGIVQGRLSHGELPRLMVGPISEVKRALRQASASGAGRSFATYAEHTPPPQPVPADAPAELIPAQDTRVHLEIEYPADGAVMPESACGAFVAGRAMALGDESKRFDVALVLDTSGSTADPTGADINGNGVIGTKRRGPIGSLFGASSTDPGDSVLAAEVAAARQILRDLDPRTTRVAVITFAGGDGRRDSGPPALTRQPLTSEFARVERSLDFILRTDPVGGTHMSGAVDHSTTELLGARGSRSANDPSSAKLVFFFTDGQPTLPYKGSISDNTRAVRRAAGTARLAGIRVHSFAIGSEALAGPIASVELADLTGGSFIPVRHPGELASVVEAMNFANLENVTLRSATTGDGARPFRVTADGSWGGFLKMVPGLNIIEISARSSDGVEVLETLEVVLEPAAESIPIPHDLGVRHNRLLEDCLRDLKQVRVAAEREHGEKVRKELLLEIGREREKARQRAAEQRKQLKLEVEEGDDSGTNEPGP